MRRFLFNLVAYAALIVWFAAAIGCLFVLPAWVIVTILL